MGFSLINIKLSTLGIIFSLILLLSSFIFFVPAETKSSLIAPDGPFYIITRTLDLFKTHQNLVEEKGVFLVEMSIKDDFENAESVFTEYKKYHNFLASRLPENLEKQKEILDFTVSQSKYFLKYANECPESTRNILKNGLLLNLDLRSRLLSKISNHDLETSIRLEGLTQELILENTPDELKSDMWEYMQSLKNT